MFPLLYAGVEGGSLQSQNGLVFYNSERMLSINVWNCFAKILGYSRILMNAGEKERV